MRTWKEITEEPSFEPEYVSIQLKDCPANPFYALMIDERIDRSTIPEGWHAYDVRHSDDDFCAPSTIERSVRVNFFCTVLVDSELPLPDDGYLEIEDWSYEDWEDMAYSSLERAGADSVEIDGLVYNWDNLDTIQNNVKRLLAPSLV